MAVVNGATQLSRFCWTDTGTPYGMFCLMDACPATFIPPGVSATHVPEWALPHAHPSPRALFRPDILLIFGHTTETPWLLHSAHKHLRFLRCPQYDTFFGQTWSPSWFILFRLGCVCWRRSGAPLAALAPAQTSLSPLHHPGGFPSPLNHFQRLIQFLQQAILLSF